MLLKNIALPFSSSNIATSKKNKVFTAFSLCLSLSAFSYTSVASAQKISGQVINNQGKPLILATVKINGSDQEVRTDKQGFFSFKQLKPGNIELHTSAKNYAHNNHHISLNKNDISNVLIELSPSVMEVLDVYATPLHSSTIESALPVSVISGDDLKLKQAATLGETLKNEVGVHSSFYGSVASSPIIRGLDGPRVLITQNGLDAGDASRIGADHAVSTETSTATQIEILRGPATLFYGSGAIGGVVNVVDNRVPTSDDETAEWLLQYNDVANEKQASFSLQNGLEIADKDFAVHLDGFWRDAGDYKLPSDFAADDNESHLASSESRASGLTFGSSYLFDQGFVGFSYGFMNKDYGIPGHHHHEEHGNVHDEDEEGTKAEMQQDRLQLLSEVNLDHNILKKVAAKFAYTDYEHKEIEEGLVGTTFTNESVEMKVDLYHQEYQGWQGAWTLHYKNSDFEAIGEEAFSPPSITDTYAFAWLEEKHFGDVLLQLGARVERVTIDVEDSVVGFDDHDAELVSFSQQNFTPISTSLGLVWDYQAGYNLGVSLAFSQRAPSAAELFSFGPHIGTNTFEVGAMYNLSSEVESNGHEEIHVEPLSKKPELESAYSIDLTWRKFEGDFGFVVSAFYNQIQNYYYQQNTGLFFEEHHEGEHGGELEEEEGLPILMYQQSDVDMFGVEAEFVYQLSSPLKATIFGDYINAKLTDGGYLPRTPPMRIGGLLNYQADSFDTELSLNHYFEQDKIASLETKTGAYTLIDMNINYYIDGFGSDLVLYAKGQNLTDELALVHSSFLKDVAPLPGRNFSIGIRGSF